MDSVKQLIPWFFGFILLYHILQTVFVFGVGWADTFSFSLIKELLWVLLVLSSLVYGRKEFVGSTKKYGMLYYLFFLLILRAIIHTIQLGIDPKTALIGFKYDIRPLFVLVSAIACGSTLQAIKRPHKKAIGRIILAILLGGILRQTLKFCFPEVFMYFGYGAIGDYILGGSPPLWYRTGPGGMMRLQGIFAGPNNYGYLLVGYFGIIAWYVKKQRNKNKGISLLIGLLYVSSLLLTISRGALVGVLVQVGLLGIIFLPKRRKRIITVLFVGGVSLVGISFSSIKNASTLEHLDSWVEGSQAFIKAPLGYGLGSSGPSVHFEGVYLPENQYLQIALDLGWPGLLLWLGVWIVLITILLKKIHGEEQGSTKKIILICFLAGLIGLLVEGLFLHTFEDSMVNYLFLGVMGLYLSSFHSLNQ